MLAAAAVVWCAASPVLSMLVRDGVVYPRQVGTAALADPLAMLWKLGVTGVYPVLTWTTYLLAGLAVGRLDLRDTRVAAALLGGGALLSAAASGASALLLGPGGGAAVLGRASAEQHFYGTTPTSTWWWLAVDAPHSGTPLDLARTTGSALAVLGLMLLLAHVARPLLWLPAAVGAAPLTLYALHVVLTTAELGSRRRPAVRVRRARPAAVGRRGRPAGRGMRGPLEAGVGVASRTARNLVLRTGSPAREP